MTASEKIRRLNAPRCARCGGPHPFDTTVPSVRWNAVIRAHGLAEYLCLTCIVRAFAKSGESFTATLWGDGFGGLPISVAINGRQAQDAAAISEENTALRSSLFAIRAADKPVREWIAQKSKSCTPNMRKYIRALLSAIGPEEEKT